MKIVRNTARGLLLPAFAGLAFLAFQLPANATDRTTPAPVAKALGDVLAQTSEPAIAGFDWGSPVATLKASKQVKPSLGFSAKCVKDIVSTAGPDCTAFVPTSGSSFARAYYATSRDGLMMVESKATLFDCARFDDLASPDAEHRARLADQGWNHVRRDRRPEGDDAVVETQLYVRNGVGVELAFIKVAAADACGVKSFVSKVL